MEVFLESEEYGYESFRTDSLKEALEMVERLYLDSDSAFNADGIPRKVGILVN